jgi:hypothetical protein
MFKYSAITAVLTLLVAVTLFGGSGYKASAATFNCDNDATSGCSNYLGGEQQFYYRTDMATYDMNHDYRLSNNYQYNDFYHWVIPTNNYTTHTYTVKAYLWNTQFTNPRANYYVDDYYQYTLNQKLATAGWNSLGTKNDYGTIDISINSNDQQWDVDGSSATGADMVQLYTSAY